MIDLFLEDATQFKKAIDAIAVLIDEAEFIIDEKGLSLKATDPSQISMVDFHLPKSAFKSYEISSPTKIGLDLAYVSSIVSRSKAKDSLQLSLGENNRLNITFKGSSTRKFTIPLIDISTTSVPNPKIEFDAELKLSADILTDGLKDASLISSHVMLGVDSKSFFLRAVSSKGTFNHDTSKDNKSVKQFQVKKESKAMFPLDYLTNMLKGASSDTEISLSLKTNAPIKLSYNIANSSINYFLAPRIESE